MNALGWHLGESESGELGYRWVWHGMVRPGKDFSKKERR